MKRAFVAIDFETADSGADSACSVGVVRVEGRRVVARVYRLIRPPRPIVYYSHIHGLYGEDVAKEPAFRTIWRDLIPLLKGAEFLAAHNAPFDARVLKACCKRSRVRCPEQPFLCTVRLARRVWSLKHAGLSRVCDYLGINLKGHHHALADAEACARIVIAARREGYKGGLLNDRKQGELFG